MTAGAVILLAVMLGLLCISAFFSGSETALFSLDRLKVSQFASSPRRLEQRVAELLARPRRLLTAVLLGNMVVNVLFFACSTVIVLQLDRQFGSLPAGLAGAGFLLLLVVFGEVTPKVLAASFNERTAKLAALPLGFFTRLSSLVHLGIDASVTKLVPGLRGGETKFTLEELKYLVEMSKTRGIIDPAEEELIQEVVDFGQMRIKQVMVPRVEMGGFNLSEPREKLVELVRQTYHSKIPAYDRDIDRIEGVIHTKEFLMNPDKPVRELVRTVAFVPETKTVESMLQEFRRTNTQFAIVVDEYAGTAGLVTLEDLAEEIVGEIEDEYDQPQEPVGHLGPGSYRLSGRLSIRDWEDIFDIGLKERHVNTVGGLVVSLLGHLPGVGEKVKLGNLVFTVSRMSRRRVEQVTVELCENGNDAERPLSAEMAAGTPRRQGSKVEKR